MVNFFGASFLLLRHALYTIHSKIRQLKRIYEWQGAYLLLALNYHTEITTVNHTDIEVCTLPRYWIDTYCTPDTVLSKKRGSTSALDGPKAKKRFKEICQNFHAKGCE